MELFWAVVSRKIGSHIFRKNVRKSSKSRESFKDTGALIYAAESSGINLFAISSVCTTQSLDICAVELVCALNPMVQACFLCHFVPVSMCESDNRLKDWHEFALENSWEDLIYGIH